MQESILLSIVVGVVCAGFIFILDRSIVVINGNRQIANMRLALGVAISILGAILVDSIILKNDVDFYMKSSFANEATSAKINTEQAFEPQIQNQSEKVEKAHNDWQKRTDEYNCEMNGTCGTKRMGVSKVALAKKDLMDQAKTEYDKQLSILGTLKEQQHTAGIIAGNAVVESIPSKAIFTRIDYMHRMVFHDPTKLIVYALFFFIALMMELAVILMKRWSNKSGYEYAEELAEKIQMRKILELDQFSRKQSEANLNYSPAAMSARDAITQRSTHSMLN